MNNNQVYHPNHYNHTDRRECWEEMIDISPEATALFDLWSAYKYKYRAGTKDGNPEAQDLAKIDNYIKHAQKLHSEYTFSDSVEQAYFKMLDKLS